MLTRSTNTMIGLLALTAASALAVFGAPSYAAIGRPNSAHPSASPSLQSTTGGVVLGQLIEFDSAILHSAALTMPDIPMLSVRATCTNSEDVTLMKLGLSSSGSGDDAQDIANIKVWVDANSNGVLDNGTDTLVGTATCQSDNSSLQIVLSPALNISAGGKLDLLVTYTLKAGLAPGKSFECWPDGAYAATELDSLPVDVTVQQCNSKYLVVGVPPISIGQAKKLPIDPLTGASEIIMIEHGVVTADFEPAIPLACMEQEDRSSGIGVYLAPGQQGERMPAGLRVTVLGRLRLAGGTELLLEPIEGAFEPAIIDPLKPVAMTSKTAGGGAFGSQPGVVDKYDPASPLLSTGLNSIGKLIKVYGRVTGYGSVTINGADIDMVWLDDGSGLMDGLSEFGGVAVMKPLDWPDDNPAPSGYVAVTGILRSIPGKDGKPVRLLMPRSVRDLTGGQTEVGGPAASAKVTPCASQPARYSQQ